MKEHLVNKEHAMTQGSGKQKKASLMRVEAQCGGLPHRLHKLLSGNMRKKNAAYAR
jgi:hypothetical protein